jgi:hypothetical protein
VNIASTPAKVGVIASNLVVAAFCLHFLTGSDGPVLLTAVAVAIASVFVVKGHSFVRAALSVYAVALVIALGWLLMRKLGIVP